MMRCVKICATAEPPTLVTPFTAPSAAVIGHVVDGVPRTSRTSTAGWRIVTEFGCGAGSRAAAWVAVSTCTRIARPPDETGCVIIENAAGSVIPSCVYALVAAFSNFTNRSDTFGSRQLGSAVGATRHDGNANAAPPRRVSPLHSSASLKPSRSQSKLGLPPPTHGSVVHAAQASRPGPRASDSAASSQSVLPRVICASPRDQPPGSNGHANAFAAASRPSGSPCLSNAFTASGLNG